MKKILSIILAALLVMCCLTACETTTVSGGTKQNIEDTKAVTDELTSSQPTPTDINYSLERYNLIRRAYWVNGQREKANALACPVDKPLGYIVLVAGNTIVGRFVVDGKVSSLNSYLGPNYVENRMHGYEVVINTELADVDGSYGENDSGIFFFTPDGKYVEWTGDHLYSDIPFEIDSPVVTYQEAN